MHIDKINELEYELARTQVEYLHLMLEMLRALAMNDRKHIASLSIAIKVMLDESRKELDNKYNKEQNGKH